jgi:hypothetical protein
MRLCARRAADPARARLLPRPAQVAAIKSKIEARLLRLYSSSSTRSGFSDA